MVFDAREGLYLPQFGNAVLGGIKGGQDIRRGLLEDYLTRKKDKRDTEAQALGDQYAQATGEQKALLGQKLQAYPEQYKQILGNESALLEQKVATDQMQRDYMARAAYDVLRAPKEMQGQLHDELLVKGVQQGLLPQEAMSHVGTFDESDIPEMERLVRGGQEFKDLTTSVQQDREFALKRQELADARAERIAAREQARLDRLEAGRKPQSPEAQLKADYEAGLLDKQTYERAIAKKTAPGEKNYKQFQLQAASFADRMTKADAFLAPFEENNIDFVNETANALSSIPSFGLGKAAGNALLSEDQQRYKNAASEWIRAKLRKESGAAIGDEEMDEEYRTYFPVAGDSKKVIEQKRQLRKNNTAGMIKQSQGAYEDEYGFALPDQENIPVGGTVTPGVVNFNDLPE